jgi:hypothetical protein
MMTELVKKILTAQFEAALAMLNQCIVKCPPEQWEGKIANYSFRQVVYHTLFFLDYYLSQSEGSFALRDLHDVGGDERLPVPGVGLSQDQTRDYVAICRDKIVASIAAETTESLQGPSGFARLPITRAELHVHNLRHLQHHTGQFSAYLRRIGLAADWVRSGWK